MHTLTKPNGTVVEVNDNSLEYALSLGWVESGKQKPRTESTETPKKRGRKPKAK